ncbi:ArnT family glycosyltransferase [Polycladidibacter stylochi]|uniref:ArnT family glycosyltransferase n=1 Tax=Polycladidibacter stylochi TaxID=1807766 RepID=UPI00082FA4D2|nr:glycosyltransferase family 39 protein [Pseudovibrio stylochi]
MRPQPNLSLPSFLRPTSLFWIVTGLTLLRLFTASQANFVEDEAYYRLWGLYPALGYYDHSPMVGWWIWLGQTLFGDTTLGARFLSVLSAAIGSAIIWRSATLLYDRVIAGWTVLFFNATLLIGVGAVLITPDSPAVFFWGLTFWALCELSASKNANWWLLVGVAAGFGLLSKYSLFFLGGGIVLWLLYVPENRRFFTSWQLWAGGLIAVVMFLPVVYWNMQHDWVSFSKQFGRVAASHYTFKYIGEYIGAVAGLLNPFVFVLVVAGSIPLLKQFRQREASASLIVCTGLPFFSYLLFHSFHDRVQGNWPAPLYPSFAMIAAVFLADRIHLTKTWVRGCGYSALVVGLSASVLVLSHAVWPITTSFGRKDPTHQMRGWQQVGKEIETIAKKENVHWVVTTSYGLTGQLSNALKGSGIKVTQLNQRMRYAMVPTFEKSPGSSPVLYVAESRRNNINGVSKDFSSSDLLAEIPRSNGNNILENIMVYHMGAPLKPIGKP